MIERLRSRSGGERIPVHRVDLADFELPHPGFDVAACAVSTFFMLPGRSYQQSSLTTTARHLRQGGRLFIEAFRPDLNGFDSDGSRVETRSDSFDAHVVRNHHDGVLQTICITPELTEGFDVTRLQGELGDVEDGDVREASVIERIDQVRRAAAHVDDSDPARDVELVDELQGQLRLIPTHRVDGIALVDRLPARSSLASAGRQSAGVVTASAAALRRSRVSLTPWRRTRPRGKKSSPTRLVTGHHTNSKDSVTTVVASFTSMR